MEKIRVEEAVGMKLCHDITKVVPGEFKGRLFARGHIIRPEDVEELKSIGKEYIYVWEEQEGKIHEDEAAIRISQAMAGINTVLDDPKEGKVFVSSKIKGLFRIKRDLLKKINSIEQITVPTIPDYYRVGKGHKLAAIRVIPLIVEEGKVESVESYCSEEGPVFEVKEYKNLKVGLIITGNEVYYGRVEDKFAAVLEDKMAYFGAEILGKTFCPDNLEKIEAAIKKYKAGGADLIVLSGGMSVDPDDLTPVAIKNTATELVTYGVPAQPGNMFMMAYSDDTPVIGVPGAAIYYKTTVLDIVLPRIFAGEIMTKEDFVGLGEGGLCITCSVCTYPRCYFGQ